MADAKAYTSLELTHVVFPSGHPIGQWMAVATMTPLVIVVSFATLVVFRRDLATIFFFIGQLLNELTNFILKRTFKEARPTYIASYKTDYGMPSSHSQFMLFFATVACLCLLSRTTHIHFEWKATRIFISVATTLTAILVAYSRVFLMYHTPEQVMVGAAVGTLTGFVWYNITESWLRPKFKHIALSRIGQFFLVVDSTHIPNVIMWHHHECLKSTIGPTSSIASLSEAAARIAQYSHADIKRKIT